MLVEDEPCLGAETDAEDAIEDAKDDWANARQHLKTNRGDPDASSSEDEAPDDDASSEEEEGGKGYSSGTTECNRSFETNCGKCGTQVVPPS